MPLLDQYANPITAPSLGVVGRSGEVRRDPFLKQCPVDDVTFANWRKRLRVVSPHHEQLSYLYLVWEPGWPWEPVGRFMLFEAIPDRFVDPEFLADLRGEDPDTINSYDSITGEFTQKTLVTALQWKIYRDIGRYARPWWVIQGEGGGHKVYLSDTEKRLMKLAGYPEEMPAPGELPYAPFDNRVLDHVVRHDKLQRANGNVKRMAAMSATGNSERSKALRREIVAWISGQMDDAAKSLIHQLEKDDAPRDVSQLTDPEVIAQREEEFIEHGKFLSVL